tara:strand:- start:3845 stop:4423 length:579 start_codon:yes stop_codon:yes gene_type:complete
LIAAERADSPPYIYNVKKHAIPRQLGNGQPSSAKHFSEAERGVLRMNILTKSCALALAGSLFAATAAAGQLSVETNKTIPVRISGAAASIVLGNKNVADVAVHNENLIFVTGKSFGTTNLMVFNKAGEQIYSTDVVVTVNASNLVTVNRSGQNFTYDCAPECRPIISIGDQADYFGNLSSQHQDVQLLNNGN